MAPDRISRIRRQVPEKPLGAGHPPKSLLPPHLLAILDWFIFGFLVLFAVALPHSIKGAERAWKIALVLWLARLLLTRTRPYWQPLTAPLLAYVVLSAISTMLSPEPYLSWDRMKFVCLVLAGIVVAQNVVRMAQVKWLVNAVLLSGLAAAAFTGWQYTHGMGAMVESISGFTRLSQAGLRPNQIITSVGGKPVKTPEDLVKTLQSLPPDSRVAVQFMTDIQTQPISLTATPNDFVQAGLGTPEFKLRRGRPFRAQGTLGHYVVFAEMLMQLGCLAWGVFLATGRQSWGWKAAYLAILLCLSWALFLTETRAAFAGLLLGCMIAFLLASKGTWRWVAVVGLLVALAGATLWIEHSRGVHWSNPNDISTHFRLLMWQDGLRLTGEHPWFGIGMETARLHWKEWNIRGFIQYRVQSHFHSTYLQIAVERGIPTLLAWLWFCVAYIAMLVRLVQQLRRESNWAWGVVAGILGAFAAFSFTGVFHYNLGEEPIAMLLFFYYGMALALERMYRESKPNADATS